MKVSVTTIDLHELDVDAVLIPVTQEARDELLERIGLDDDAVKVGAAQFTGAVDESVTLYVGSYQAKRVVLLGLGSEDAVALETLRNAAATGASTASRLKVETVSVVLPETELAPEAASQALVEGFLLGSYRFTRYKTTDANASHKVQRLVVHSSSHDKAARRGADRGRILAEAVSTARDLVNLSPNDKTPTLLGKEIERLGKKHGFEVSVWDKALIEEEQMGGLLAVNMGSIEPPTFTIMEWQPENAVNDRPIVLVGKGVVFDTGGLSLKPTKDSMDSMKSDMAGAAAVVGTMEAIAKLELPVYVVAMIPATDNRPGENAYVPGDVIRMHSGLTVEVLNTDAEGRMILADALSYASTYTPAVAIDLATLTGAAVVALGSAVAAVMTNEDEHAADRTAAMVLAGERSGDPVHPLPMHDHYADLLKSDVADLKNVGGREAGSITAGKFLERFTSYPWIHVDIAGPAFLKSARGYRQSGGTGFGVRLVVEYLRDFIARAQK
ncbi:MAG: leucyl aminopeptidase [Rhodothermales bacterium]|nr:leucyl aminopeptidase [Rhodothermales bacterium]